MLDPAGDARRIDFDADRDAVVHGHGQWLSAAHATEPAGEGDGSGKGSVEAQVRDRGKSFIGPLQDALRADINPRPGRHLAVHCEAQLFEASELVPVGPVPHKIGVGE